MCRSGFAPAVLLLAVVLAGCAKRQETEPAAPGSTWPATNAPAPERLAAAQRLAGTRQLDAAAAAFLHGCLGAPEPDLRLAAATALAANADSLHWRAAMALSADTNAVVRRGVLAAGARLVGRPTVSWVQKARQDPDPLVRREALWLLAKWADPNDPELPWQWVAALQDPAPAVAAAAAELLAARGRGLVPIVQQAAVAADGPTRLRLARLIAGLQDPELTPTLLWILRSSDWAETGNYDPELRAGVIAAAAGLGRAGLEPVRLGLARTKLPAGLRAVIEQIAAQVGAPATEWPAAAPASQALVAADHNLELCLAGGVAGRDLRVEFACRQGVWPLTGWGYAVGYNKADHEATVRGVTLAPGGAAVALDVMIADDPWQRGGPAAYTVLLTGQGTNWSGHWRGHFRGVAATGLVGVAFAPALPVIEPVRPLRLQEHPRWARAATEFAPPRHWQRNEAADEQLEQALQPKPPALNVEWAVPAAAMAQAYDALYWQASPALRRAGADAVLGMGRGLLFGPPAMSTPWHNWQGRWRAGAGVCLLSGLGDPCSYPLQPPPTEPVLELSPQTGLRPPGAVPVHALNATASDGSAWLGEHWYRWDAPPSPVPVKVLEGGELDLSAALGEPRPATLRLAATLTNGFAQTVRVRLGPGTRGQVGDQELVEGAVLHLPVGLYAVRVAVDTSALMQGRWRVPQLVEIEDPRRRAQRWREGFAYWQLNGGASPEAERWLDLAQINCARYIRWAVGDGGFTTEKERYTSNTLDEMLPFLRGLRSCRGRNLIADSHAAWIPLRAKAGRFGDEGGARFWGGPALVEFLTPPFRAALQARTPAEFPGYGIRDRQKAGYVFRNGWHGDAQDIFLTVEGKGQHLRGAHTSQDTGTFRLFGLGAAWAVYRSYGRDAPREVHNVVHLPDDPINGLLPAREQHHEIRADGSGSVTLDLDDVFLAFNHQYEGGAVDYEGRVKPQAVRDLGIRARRACGIDFSGRSGAPAVVVIADQIRGGQRRVWSMHLPASVTAELDGRSFRLRSRKTDATVAGTFLVPADVQLQVADGRLLAAGTSDFLVVMTLQRGHPPAVAAADHTVTAPVRIGNQTVRFTGERLEWDP